MFMKEGTKTAESDRYRDFIKKVPDNDWVQAICGDVKISAAGASKAIQKSKANKAKNKKKK
jgi:predicted Zn-dependent protease